MSYTRTRVREIVTRVIDQIGTDDPVALETAIQRAYPFKERRGYLYAVWQEEVRKQLRTALEAPQPDATQMSLL